MQTLIASDWKIFRAVRTYDRIFKWHVTGWNRNDCSEICWSVRDLDDPRYDMSDAVIVGGGMTATHMGTGVSYWAAGPYQTVDTSG